MHHNAADIDKSTQAIVYIVLSNYFDAHKQHIITCEHHLQEQEGVQGAEDTAASHGQAAKNLEQRLDTLML